MRRVLVTGGKGFLGSHIGNIFDENGDEVYVVGREDADLRELEQAIDLVADIRPELVIHCACESGGILFNKNNGDRIFYNNTVMSLNLLKAASLVDSVDRIIPIISSCAYPDTTEDLIENMFWDGIPNRSIAYFGLQKRNLVAYAMALYEKYKLKCLCPVINNLFGENDSYDLGKTKVVGAMIKKFVDAKRNNDENVVCLGTGSPTRQFTYVKDAAKAVLLLSNERNWITNHPSDFIVNVTTDEETSIRQLAELTKELTGYAGNIIWDTTKQDGQLRKSMNCDKAKALGITCATPLKEGLKKTIEWYEENY